MESLATRNLRCCGAGALLQLMGNTCSNVTRMDESVYREEEPSNTSRSPHHGAVGQTGSSDTSITPPVAGAADLGVQQPPQVAVRSGTSTACQLHDSAASKHCARGDQTGGKVKFLTRKDTANIDEASHIFPSTTESAPEQAETLFVQMPPFEARKNFLLGPPRPACCPERSKTAEGINKLRQTDDPDINSILRLACKVFASDMACCSLLTGDAYHVIAGTGPLLPGICPDRWGFCAWSFLNSNHELLVVEDLKNDVRFSENFFVKDPHYDLRFYAGCPLVTSNGHRLGILCLVGQEPAEFDATRGQVLSNIAELLVRQLERKWAESEARQGHMQLMRSLACYDEAFLFLDTSRKGDWRVLHMNQAASKLLECDWAPLCLPDLAAPGQPQQCPSSDGVALSTLLEVPSDCMSQDEAQTPVTVRGAAGAGPAPSFQLHLRQARADSISPGALQIGSPAFLHDNPTFGKHYYLAALVPLVSEQLDAQNPQLTAEPVPTCGGPRPAKPSRHMACLPSTGPFEGLLLGSLVGKGSFGRVYRGLWKGQLVGVKVIRDIHRLKLDPYGEPMEVLLTRDLKHPSVMKTISHAWWKARDRGGLSGEQQCWMILEYCDRGSIMDAVQQGWFRTSRSPTAGVADLRTVAMTALEIASAMAFLHSKSIVHGDLSGGNVMLTSSPINPHGFQAKVGDFGLSREANASARLAGNVYGTITHMAPEVMLHAHIGPAVDVYAFGVLLWEMLTGTRAWAGLRHANIICLVGVQKQTLAPPEGLHPVLQSLLGQCLSRSPEERPSFKGIADTLSHFVQVTRGTDPAELWAQGASPGGCLCPQTGAGCCLICNHAAGCADAACFCCQMPSSSGLLARSTEEHRGNKTKGGKTASQYLRKAVFS
ncbi:hypothetical protein ABBQ32_002806 [Trebouxia sp. C0010 RCD-2024]